MGYCIHQVEAVFSIKSEKKQEALKALKEMRPKNSSSWSWVTLAEIKGARTLEEAMDAWGYTCDVDNDGNVTHVSFTREKLGDEALMFKVLAPFVESPSYIEMHGEDGNLWRWVFKDGSMKEVYPEVSWGQ